MNKFFYARAKVFEVTNARPIWQRTVGDPSGGGVRTYSLMTNRFPDHTSLYVRVEDKENSLVYATFSLGRVISFDEPQAEVDRENQLHVLQCSAPRVWSYSIVGLDGRLLKHTTYSQARSMPATPSRQRRHRGGGRGNARCAGRSSRRRARRAEIIRSTRQSAAGRLSAMAALFFAPGGAQHS